MRQEHWLNRSAILGILLTATATGAQADNCHPLTLITSVDLVPSMNNTWQYAPVSINGRPKLMLVDTGGFMSEITPQAAEEFGLPHRSLGFRQLDISGESSREAVVVDSFGLGRLTAKDVELVIAPEKHLFGDSRELVGIIGPNILKNYDVDIDFGAHKLNLISPDHCEGKVVYWKAAAVAAVPMTVLPSGHIIVSVKLDGHDLRAILDTGASGSTITQSVAEGDFGLRMGSPDTPRAGAMEDRPNAATFRHLFSSLSFGGVSASNPEVAIIPDLVNHPLEQEAPIGTRFADTNVRDEAAPMLLGMNILRHLHIYIAYKERMLYISPASGPATALPGAAAH